MDEEMMDWQRSLQGILGELASLERRLQSQPETVEYDELKSAAEKVDKLKTLAPPTGPQSGPWDIFYRKYSALLQPHLEKVGLRPSAPAPPVWDFNNALEELTEQFNESESKLQTTKFVAEFSRVVEQLESGRQVSDQELQPLLDQMEEMADGVLELAPEYPQLPAQFARLRERLWVLLEKRDTGEGG
jgi:hypothetical protein